MKWKKSVEFVSHKKSQGKNDKNYGRFIQTSTAQIFTQTCRKSTLFDRVEFTHTFLKLSGNTRQIFIKLFEELVSHYFSYLVTF